MNTETFRLGRMSGLILTLTVLVLLVPVALAWANLWPVALLVVALYGLVWTTMRPSSFEVGDIGITLRFPMRTAVVDRKSIKSAEEIDKEAFKAKFGVALRIGVGGLWGGFGWLWTSKQGLIDFYISRTDDFVLIERAGGRPLVLSPENPAAFVAAVDRLLAG